MAINVPRRRRALRWMKNFAFGLAACYVALLFFVQVSERVMRHRAERLLSEMRDLQAGEATWASLQRIMTRWGAWGDHEGICTEMHCVYTVFLADLPGNWRFAAPVSFLGHGHSAIASLHITEDKGNVKQASYVLWVEVPKGYGARWEREEPQDAGYQPYSGGPYTLIARASSVAELEHLCCYWPNPIPHPDYVLRKPGGCENCLAIWTEFLPQATSAEKLWLTNLNFNCITRWKPCADEEDIMPEAGAEYARQRRASMLQSRRLEQCSYSIDDLSKAALNAAVVQIESFTKDGSTGQEYSRVRLTKRLGGSALWNPRDTVEIDALVEGQQGKLLAKAFIERRPLIVLFQEAPEENLLMPYTCGLLPYTDQTEKDVIAGVLNGKGFAEFE